MAQKIYLSVVIPCFEEMANLQKGVLDKVNSFLSKQKYSFEVIIVDDGSSDESVEFIKTYCRDNKNFRLLERKHLGKAGAVTAGVLDSLGEIVLFTDMDQATPIEEVQKLLPFFAKDFDIVIGSRAYTRKGSPLVRRFISRANIMLRKIIVGLPEISDTQCGFKMFRFEVAQKLFQRISALHNGFRKISGSSVSSGFDVELLYLAEQMGYRTCEVPVRWLYVETRRVNPIKDSIDGVSELLKIKRNAMQGDYNS